MTEPIYWSTHLWEIWVSDDERDMFYKWPGCAYPTREKAYAEARARRSDNPHMVYYLRLQAVTFELVDQPYPEEEGE